MKAWTDQDIEKLLKQSALPDPAHKQALGQRLFAQSGDSPENDHHQIIFMKRRRTMENRNEELMQKLFSGKLEETELQNLDMRELDLEDLEAVAGGTMTESDIATLVSALKMAKKSGLSLKEVLGYVDQYYPVYHSMYPKVTKEEVVKYIKEHWNSL